MNQYITDTASNLSTDMALVLSKIFIRSISQNHDVNQTGVSLWTLEDVEKAQARQRAEAEAAAAPRRIGIEEDDDDEYGDGGLSDHVLAEMDLDE